MNLDQIAERFGTPAYVYRLDAVRAALTDLHRALPEQVGLYYSLKANPHPRLVAELTMLGCEAEVSSRGEVEAATAAGADPAAMLLTGPGKTEDTIAHALAAGVRRFSVDSPRDLARVGMLSALHGIEAECLLRVNVDDGVPGMGLAMTGTASQFGADASWVARSPELFRRSDGARVTGLHLYMGTNIEDEDALLSQFEVSAAVAARLIELLGPMDEVDLGGGFGTPFARAGDRPRFPTLAERLTALLDARLAGWRSGRPRITFESGRYLVGDSGVLICRVVDVKESKQQRFAVLDAGVNHLGGMVGLRRLPPILPSIRPLAGDEGTGAASTTVVGPLCTPLDTFARNAELPRLVPGQLLTIPNAGAYGVTASLLAFLGHPAPVEVVVDEERVVGVSRLVVTRTETAEPVRRTNLTEKESA